MSNWKSSSAEFSPVSYRTDNWSQSNNYLNDSSLVLTVKIRVWCQASCYRNTIRHTYKGVTTAHKKRLKRVYVLVHGGITYGSSCRVVFTWCAALERDAHFKFASIVIVVRILSIGRCVEAFMENSWILKKDSKFSDSCSTIVLVYPESDGFRRVGAQSEVEWVDEVIDTHDKSHKQNDCNQSGYGRCYSCGSRTTGTKATCTHATLAGGLCVGLHFRRRRCRV